MNDCSERSFSSLCGDDVQALSSSQCPCAGLMSDSSEQLAVMRPAYMNLPSPNITCPEEEEDCQADQQVSWTGWSPPGPGAQAGGDTQPKYLQGVEKNCD